MCVSNIIVTSDVFCNVYGLFGQDKRYIEIVKAGVYAAHLLTQVAYPTQNIVLYVCNYAGNFKQTCIYEFSIRN